jgi:hypothetical protein
MWSALPLLFLIAPCAVLGSSTTADSLVLSPFDATGNLRYPQLSVRWWQWAVSSPISRNPLVDLTGKHASVGQSGKVFFLGGTFSIGSQDSQATRTITVPRGTYLFFPIVNSEFDNAFPPILNVDDSRRGAAQGYNNVSSIYATIDGRPVTDLLAHRTLSPVFQFTLPNTDGVRDKNIYQLFGVNVVGLVTQVVGDGYYVLVKPLSVGRHTITFGGTLSGSEGQLLFRLAITYHITVR